MNAPETVGLKTVGHWISGRPFLDDKEEEGVVFDPALGRETKKVKLAGPQTVSLAMDAAAKAFPEWANTPPVRRARVMFAFKSWVEQNREALAKLITSEHGKTLDDAVDLVLYAFEHGRNGEIFVQKAPAATIETLAKAIVQMMGKPAHPINVIGTRHGEKLYEVLCSREEMSNAEDLGGYFRIRPDMRDLNYGRYFDQGEKRISESEDYNSHNTQRLDVEGMKALLLKLDFMRDIVAGRTPELVD